MENELQDLLAALKAKMKNDSSYQPMHDKAENKLKFMSAFMADSRLLLAQWDMLEVSDQVPDKVLEDLEALINDQVGYSEGGKIAKSKIKAVL